MDENTNVSKGESGNSQPGAFHYLKRIDPLKWDKDRVQWLWEKLQTQDYAFDDIGKNRGDFFCYQLFQPSAESYELMGDEGFVLVTDIVPKVNACIHFVAWGDIELSDILGAERELLKHLFTTHSLNRVSAFIPVFNKKAIKLATISGFRYEGEIRESFLKDGVFYNTQLYGLLKKEYLRQEVRH